MTTAADFNRGPSHELPLSLSDPVLLPAVSIVYRRAIRMLSGQPEIAIAEPDPAIVALDYDVWLISRAKKLIREWSITNER